MHIIDVKLERRKVDKERSRDAVVGKKYEGLEGDGSSQK